VRSCFGIVLSRLSDEKEYVAFRAAHQLVARDLQNEIGQVSWVATDIFVGFFRASRDKIITLGNMKFVWNAFRIMWGDIYDFAGTRRALDVVLSTTRHYIANKVTMMSRSLHITKVYTMEPSDTLPKCL
jgi:hypothetical protein